MPEDPKKLHEISSQSKFSYVKAPRNYEARNSFNLILLKLRKQQILNFFVASLKSYLRQEFCIANKHCQWFRTLTSYFLSDIVGANKICISFITISPNLLGNILVYLILKNLKQHLKESLFSFRKVKPEDTYFL